MDYDEDDFISENSHEIVRVAVYEDTAYWVYNHRLFTAETTREPNFETARPVDVNSLSEDEMSKIFNILDEIENHVEGE